MADLMLLRERLFNTPHFVLPSYAETVATVLADRMRVRPLMSQDDIDVRPRTQRSPMLTQKGVLVLPVVGGLVHRGDSIGSMSGSQGYTGIQSMLVEALNNPLVKGVLLDVDSPGGQASGCFELCDAIMRVGKSKPVRAIANSLAASAAYAILSSASRVYAAPSADVGSIGVVTMHADFSKQIEEAGVVVTYIFAGKHKIDGNPFEKLSADVKERIQSRIDAAYGSFVALVAARRPMTEKQVRATEAAIFGAAEAKRIGLVDEIASYDAALAAFERDLNPVVRVSRTGEVSTMSTENAPVAVASHGGPRIEGLADALAQARADGEASARAAMNQSVVDAYLRGRTDAAAILGHAEAAGRTGLAASLAANGKLTVDECVASLTSAPRAEAAPSGTFTQKVIETSPKVGAGDAKASSPVDDYQAGVANHVHRMLGVKQ